MGARPHKNNKKNKKRSLGQKNQVQVRQAMTSANVPRDNDRPSSISPIAVTKPTKSGTITAIDYFGFPVSVFGADLKKTGWATLVILVILGAIAVVTRVS